MNTTQRKIGFASLFVSSLAMSAIFAQTTATTTSLVGNLQVQDDAATTTIREGGIRADKLEIGSYPFPVGLNDQYDETDVPYAAKSSIAIGPGASSNAYSLSIGEYAMSGGIYSFSLGPMIDTFSSPYSFSFGDHAYNWNSPGAFVFGASWPELYDSPDSFLFGSSTYLETSPSSFLFGNGSSIQTGNSNYLFGKNTHILESYKSYAFGTSIYMEYSEGTFLFGTGSHAESAVDSFAFGKNSYLDSPVINGFSIGVRSVLSCTSNSFALGTNAAVYYSDSSYALGRSAVIEGNSDDSFAIGTSTYVESQKSYAIGYNARAGSGDYGSYAIGHYARAYAADSYVIGKNLLSIRFGEYIIGSFNDLNGTIADYDWNCTWDPESPLFTVANGRDEQNRSNALIIYKNGNAEFKENLTVEKDVVLKKRQGDVWMGEFGNAIDQAPGAE